MPKHIDYLGHCFTLIHDALIWTKADMIHSTGILSDSIAEKETVTKEDFLELKKNLIKLGLRVNP